MCLGCGDADQADAAPCVVAGDPPDLVLAGPGQAGRAAREGGEGGAQRSRDRVAHALLQGFAHGGFQGPLGGGRHRVRRPAPPGGGRGRGGCAPGARRSAGPGCRSIMREASRLAAGQSAARCRGSMALIRVGVESGRSSGATPSIVAGESTQWNRGGRWPTSPYSSVMAASAAGRSAGRVESAWPNHSSRISVACRSSSASVVGLPGPRGPLIGQRRGHLSSRTWGLCTGSSGKSASAGRGILTRGRALLLATP